MTHFKWIRKEIPRWVEENIITAEEGKNLLSKYGKEKNSSKGEGIFVLAATCFLAGIAFVCAGFWQDLTQDERFFMALFPLVLSIFLMALILWKDKLIKDPPKKERIYGGTDVLDETLSYGGLSDSMAVSAKREDRVKDMGNRLNSESKRPFSFRLIPSETYHHRIPDILREGAAVFHGLAFLGALWLINHSFKLSDDLFVLLGVSSIFLLLMTYISGSAGLGILYMGTSLALYRLSPDSVWMEIISWVLFVAALPLLAKLLEERRHKAAVGYSWVWVICVLVMLFWMTSALLWQMLFFALAAALTWMAGALMESGSTMGGALRIFGGASVFAVLLEGSWSPLWTGATGNWPLWILFFLILAADAVLLTRMTIKKEGLALLAGLTPFVMLIAASVSVFEMTGAYSALIVSLFSIFLGVSVIVKGIMDDSDFLKWAGALLILGTAALRVIDSTLTFGERGLFFLAAGVVAALIFLLSFVTRAVKSGRRKERRKAERNRAAKEKEKDLPSSEAQNPDITEINKEGGEER